MKINRCPKCGREPKVTLTQSYLTLDGFVKVECQICGLKVTNDFESIEVAIEKMTAKELQDAIEYTGQEHCMRKLCLERGLVPIEKLALMTTYQVAEIMAKHYEILGFRSGGESILLVEKKDWNGVWSYMNVLSR